jgi:DNA repair ATPase RecN
MKTIKLTSLLAFLAVLALPLTAAPAAKVDDNIYNYLQLLRSDFNSAKVEIINRIMKLSADDAKKFWPIYREYEGELGTQAIHRAEFIAEFVQAHKDGTFDNARAKDMAKRWFKVQRARLDLIEKYHAKIEKALSPIQAGQFLQIENQLAIFIDMTIASEMPLVGEKVR